MGLLREADTIQTSKQKSSRAERKGAADPARHFADRITAGKLSAALHTLAHDDGGGVHSITDIVDGKIVRDILKEKHPSPEPADDTVHIPGEPPSQPHLVYFSGLGREAIRKAALHTQGAEIWRHMCSNFADSSATLCDALASCARRMATAYIDPNSLTAFTACRLIALDKCPGVRPIGIGEVVRQIISKAILSIDSHAVQEAVGCDQLCAGLDCGIEVRVHVMQSAFAEDDTDGIIMADASNTFNRLNQQVCLRNVQHLCPPLATILINTYREPAHLYIDSECILSKEGTTQGDPLAMHMYALGMLPLIRAAAGEETVQSWFADDSSAAGRLNWV
eukprot:scpid36324/ scgid4473/ 